MKTSRTSVHIMYVQLRILHASLLDWRVGWGCSFIPIYVYTHMHYVQTLQTCMHSLNIRTSAHYQSWRRQYLNMHVQWFCPTCNAYVMYIPLETSTSSESMKTFKHAFTILCSTCNEYVPPETSTSSELCMTYYVHNVHTSWDQHIIRVDGDGVDNGAVAREVLHEVAVGEPPDLDIVWRSWCKAKPAHTTKSKGWWPIIQERFSLKSGLIF